MNISNKSKIRNRNSELRNLKNMVIEELKDHQHIIQKVIDFYSFSGLHPLIGLKCIQYFKWLTDLRNSYCYRNLNFPK